MPREQVYGGTSTRTLLGSGVNLRPTKAPQSVQSTCVLPGLLKCTVRTLNLALYKHPRAVASVHLLSSFPSLVPQLLLAFPPAASKTTSTLSQRRGRPTCPFDNILYGPSDP